MPLAPCGRGEGGSPPGLHACCSRVGSRRSRPGTPPAGQRTHCAAAPTAAWWRGTGGGRAAGAAPHLQHAGRGAADHHVVLANPAAVEHGVKGGHLRGGEVSGVGDLLG